MDEFDVFSVRDLRNKSGELLRDAEAGQISLITKHGKPAILAVPFDNHLISRGVPLSRDGEQTIINPVKANHSGAGKRTCEVGISSKLSAKTTSEIQCHKQLWTIYIPTYTGFLIVFLIVNIDIKVVVP